MNILDLFQVLGALVLYLILMMSVLYLIREIRDANKRDK